eukprot:1089562-Alexandrium_andersonii.AAC.1
MPGEGQGCDGAPGGGQGAARRGPAHCDSARERGRAGRGAAQALLRATAGQDRHHGPGQGDCKASGEHEASQPGPGEGGAARGVGLCQGPGEARGQR